MEKKQEEILDNFDLAADNLLHWSLKVRDLPPEFLMMKKDNPEYYQFQKWLTKYQIGLHCITDLEISCCEELSEEIINRYLKNLYRQGLIKSLLIKGSI